MNASRTTNRFDRITTGIIIAWLLAGTFGDELVGLALYGWESDALSLSMTQSWWWYYQLIVLLVFAPILMGTYLWRWMAKPPSFAESPDENTHND